MSSTPYFHPLKSAIIIWEHICKTILDLLKTRKTLLYECCINNLISIDDCEHAYMQLHGLFQLLLL